MGAGLGIREGCGFSESPWPSSLLRMPPDIAVAAASSQAGRGETEVMLTPSSL